MGHLQLIGLTKKYDAEEAVSRINLQVNEGEFVVMVGPSGCGKSTTLRMIAGLETITEGQLLLNGKELNDVHSSKRNMAMVFQSYALYPHMTVYENIAFGMQVRRVPRQIIRQRVNEAAEILQLKQVLNRKPRELSGGQNQRVALGRAIVREPAVFLMDEPLSNLDAKLRSQMRLEIRELQQRLEATMIYVTHDQVEAMTMGDKIAVMRNGRLQQLGTPIELYNRPFNRFVGQFIGSPPMNFLAGQVEQSTGGLYLACEENRRFLLSRNVSDPLSELAGRRVLAGIRAESLELDSENTGIGYPFRVSSVEVLGSESLINLSVGSGTWTAKLQGQHIIGRGTSIRLRLDPKQIHLFDADNEERLDDRYQIRGEL